MTTWPEVMAADLHLFIDAADAGWPFYHVDRPLVDPRKHGGQGFSVELALRDGLVEVFDAYRFEDPVAEELWRYRLASAPMFRAGAGLRCHHAGRVRHDVQRAVVHSQTLR
jgi:hypothetical protein